ncbi:MAG: hypothetical protein HUK19_02195 [Fibrobacter sp.]|nr:hypothetical protein [Fibrobacter sp.]
MRKLILPLAILGTVGLVSAADIEIHGDINLDYGSYFDKDFDPKNAANQDIDLSVKAILDENVSVVVKANSRSNYRTGDGKLEESDIRHGFARSAAMGDSEQRFTGFDFDGAQLRWDVYNNVSLIFGDMTYSAGTFNHYFWRDPSRYAVIVREQSLRGIGAEFGTEKYGYGKAYLGASDNNDHTVAAFATYALPLINRPNEHLILTPSVDWVFGSNISRPNTYVLGTEVDYSKSMDLMNVGVYAVWGLHPYKNKGTHSFLVEPSFNYDFFNMSATFFYAITNSNYAAEPQLFTDDQLLVAVEPSFNLHKKFTVGVSYEFHNHDVDIDNDSFHFLGANFYLYPTLKTEAVFWAGYNFSDKDNGPFVDKRLAMGMSAKASF